MKNSYQKLFVFAILAISLASCYKHNWDKLYPPSSVTQPTCTIPDTVSYSHDIVPIVNTNCGTSGSQATGCHGSGGLGGDFTTYQHFSGYTSPDSTSDVYYDITWSPQAAHNMPQGAAQLSSCDINKIIRWMDQGSLNN